MIKVVYGDLIKMAKEGKFTCIVHGCNCQKIMGAGIALQIKHEFPEACGADLKTITGDMDKLGTVSYYHYLDKNLTVVNAYTQYDPGPFASLDHVKNCLVEIKERFGNTKMKFGLPLIGCGIGGLNWEHVQPIISEVLKDEDVTVVKYRKE